MRPEHRCSGKPHPRRDLAGDRRDASMRPEHRCSGKPAGEIHRVEVLDASMRPEHRCSGKRSAPRRRRSRPPRFNEAGASLLRKTGVNLVRGALLARASMRPEHRCSGKPTRKFTCFAIRYCFNEAGASLLRKTCQLVRLRQPGPRFNEAGASLLRKTYRSETRILSDVPERFASAIPFAHKPSVARISLASK